jgi:predicted dehydrogenase
MVGCGFVADYYMATIQAYPGLKIVGVWDRDASRLDAFSSYYALKAYGSEAELLEDREVEIVVNLTDPRSHYEVSMACLNAGKHVYSEKPLAMNFDDAQALVTRAGEADLRISSAPCSVLGRTARTLSHAVRTRLCGEVKLVYAELDDGLVHKMAYDKWTSRSGAPWPYRDEFEVGCTLEHAGYYLAWLLEMFGPVRSVTAFSDCLVPEKVASEEPLRPPDTADVSFGVLKFESGVVARLSTTIVAPHDHSIRIIGDEGVLSVEDCWDNSSPVHFRRLMRIRRKSFLSPWKKVVKPPFRMSVYSTNKGATRMDFLLGVQALADAVQGEGDHLMDAEFSLHVNEVALALQFAGTESSTYLTKSRFRPRTLEDPI